jgi:2-hydroxymuconate-semialdehyde hydrolase
MADLPVEARWLDVGGVSTFLLEGGRGPSIVLLHGGIESGGAYWARVIARLAHTHTLIVPDAPGLGETDPVSRADSDAVHRWLDELIRLTCPEEPVLVAHSLLGSIAARFAIDRGRLLRRLVLIGAPGIGPYRLPLGLLMAAIRSDLRPTERNLERFLPWPFLDPEAVRRQDPEWFRAFLAYMVARQAVPHVKQMMRWLIRAGTVRIADSELRRIEVPTTLLWGRQDRMVPVGLAERAQASFGWPLSVIDDSGHVPFLERPDEFVGALERALYA